MRIFERGTGAPLAFVPGLQGRWEYTRPTIAALAEHFRVVTFSLCDEPSADAPFDPTRGFDSYGDQVIAALDAASMPHAVLCGVSFGGPVAINAAARYPDRVTALVLASAPGPGFRLRRRHEIYARLPWIFGPLFMVELPFRARSELRSALPALQDRCVFAARMLGTAIAAPVSPSRMAARARLITSSDPAPACTAITAPTLVVTGEAGLDFVVDVSGTSRYARLIAGARHVVLERTGHQGTLTRPQAFADLVREFVDGQRHAAA